MRGTDSVFIRHRRRNRNTLIILLGTCFSFLVGTPFLWGQLPPASAPPNRVDRIDKISVVGNRKIPDSVVLNNVRTKVGDIYNQSVTRADCEKISRLGCFRKAGANIRPLGDGKVEVEFVVEELLNLVKDVKIRNARHLKHDDILLLSQVRRWKPLDPNLNKRVAKEIEDYYHQKGRLFATCTLLEGDKRTDDRVIFNVTEGPIVRIRSVSFTGNETLASQARLRTQIMSKAALFQFIGGVYNKALVDNDVLKLQEYYRGNGYRNVEVSRELRFNKSFSMVDIIFHIREGLQFHIGKTSVIGSKNFSATELSSVTKVQSGEKYNSGKVGMDMRNLEEYMGWRGYDARVVKHLPTPKDQEGVVNVVYEVMEPATEPATVGEIIIIGNTVTKDRVIRRVLGEGLLPGQTLRYPSLRIAENNLNRLNLFENNPALGVRPTVTVIEDGSGSPVKNIQVNVKETYTGSLMFGLGVNSDAGLVGNIVLNERNFDLFRPPLSLNDIFEGRAFRGAGQELRIEAVPGTELQRYTVSFREPFLFDRPYSLTVAGYYYDRVFSEYTERRIGSRVSIGHQINRFWSVSGGVRVEAVRVDDVPSFAPSDYTDVAGQNFLVAPRFTVTRDSRDSFLRPTDGSMVQGSIEYAFGDFNYPVLNAEGSKFFTLFQRRDGSGKQVLAAHAQVSWAGDDVPVYERFFAGGYRSLRGFDFRGVGPIKDGFRVGGNFMTLASLEYQIPVRANDQFYLVGFLDTGTVESGVQFTDYRVSAGVGARIVVPMMGPVPIALDFGFPIVRAEFDDERIFSFYVGLVR